MMLRRAILAGLIAALAPVADAAAGSWEAGSFRFSDDLGGFEILSVTGTGIEADPVVITERFTRPEPGILTIRLGPEAASDFIRLSVVIVVINRSRRTWVGFDLELQEHLHQPSVYVDGLSFDQMHVFTERVFRSDRFGVFSDLTEPYDRVRFEGGHVDHGDRVQMRLFITDVTPKQEFYLLQEPQFLSAALPTTGSRDVAVLPSPEVMDEAQSLLAQPFKPVEGRKSLIHAASLSF
jgi:hypothetical protein